MFLPYCDVSTVQTMQWNIFVNLCDYNITSCPTAAKQWAIQLGPFKSNYPGPGCSSLHYFISVACRPETADTENVWHVGYKVDNIWNVWGILVHVTFYSLLHTQSFLSTWLPLQGYYGDQVGRKGHHLELYRRKERHTMQPKFKYSKSHRYLCWKILFSCQLYVSKNPGFST